MRDSVLNKLDIGDLASEKLIASAFITAGAYIARHYDGDVDDLTQRVVVEFWKACVKERPRNPDAFVITIARRRIIDQIRHRRNRNRLTTVAILPEHGAVPSKETETRRLLRQELQELTEKYLEKVDADILQFVLSGYTLKLHFPQICV